MAPLVRRHPRVHEPAHLEGVARVEDEAAEDVGAVVGVVELEDQAPGPHAELEPGHPLDAQPRHGGHGGADHAGVAGDVEDRRHDFSLTMILILDLHCGNRLFIHIRYTWHPHYGVSHLYVYFPFFKAIIILVTVFSVQSSHSFSFLPSIGFSLRFSSHVESFFILPWLSIKGLHLTPQELFKICD